MMRAYIYTGGAVFTDRIYEHPKEEDLIIAADSGWHNAQRLGVKPQVLLGDFDSIGTGELPDVVEILQVPAEKDQTDTELAIETALKEGCSDLVFLGATGSRLDHSLGNIFLLEGLLKQGIHAEIVNENNRLYLKNRSFILYRNTTCGDFLSLLPLSETVEEVTLTGFKYPVEQLTFYRERTLGISNEITEEEAKVEFLRGTFIVVESRDK